MTEHEKIKLQSLNILKNGVINKHNKCNKYKKNYSSVLFIPRQIQFTPSHAHVSTASISTFFKLEETELDSDSIEIYSKLKYHSINKYNFVTKGKRIIAASKK
jgi:D-lyxose ketol-isomerase